MIKYWLITCSVWINLFFLCIAICSEYVYWCYPILPSSVSLWIVHVANWITIVSQSILVWHKCRKDIE